MGIDTERIEALKGLPHNINFRVVAILESFDQRLKEIENRLKGEAKLKEQE
jgi:hypothetical protein